MGLSIDRILTTHVGSLPRPADLVDLLRKEDRGEPVDTEALQRRIADAVSTSVREQVAAGIDFVCDGEMGKMSYPPAKGIRDITSRRPRLWGP